MFRIVLIILCVSLNKEVLAFLFGSEPDWDGLRTTWGIRLFSSFNSQPRTESDALNKDFIRISDCNVSAPILGKRYVKNGDYSLILIYDINGFIAGIQIGIPNQSNTYPPVNQRNHPFVLVGDRWFLTAYFVDPGTICSGGRSRIQFENQGTGTGVYIQNGTNPLQNTFQIPMDERVIRNTEWVFGRCFYTMGNHYWYKISTDMNCNNFFPVFAMYNQGKLNSFGWAMAANMSSSNLEHPPQSALNHFFKTTNQPRCLSRQPVLTTMHIYLTNSPLFNFC